MMINNFLREKCWDVMLLDIYSSQVLVGYIRISCKTAKTVDLGLYCDVQTQFNNSCEPEHIHCTYGHDYLFILLRPNGVIESLTESFHLTSVKHQSELLTASRLLTELLLVGSFSRDTRQQQYPVKTCYCVCVLFVMSGHVGVHDLT